MERIIRVTGKGKISVKPDTIRLLITQSTKFALHMPFLPDDKCLQNSISLI